MTVISQHSLVENDFGEGQSDEDLRVLLLRLRDGKLVSAEPLDVPVDMLTRRKKVFYFLYYVEFGGKKGGGPAIGSVIQQLGYPTFRELKSLSDEVEREQPELTRAYRWAFRERREAMRRFAGTETRESWYLYQKHVGQQTFIERKRAINEAFQRLDIKHRTWQLLERPRERARAQADIVRSLEKIQALRTILFDKYEVPEGFRHLT